MRRVIYSVAMSLDGYIAGPKGESDWIPIDPTFDWDGFVSRFDTVLMGRKTFELATKAGSNLRLPSMRTFVFSRSLQARDHPEVTIVSENAASRVAELRKETGKEIWLMGGGAVFRSLLESDVVDGWSWVSFPSCSAGGQPFLPSLVRSVRLSAHLYETLSRAAS